MKTCYYEIKTKNFTFIRTYYQYDNSFLIDLMYRDILHFYHCNNKFNGLRFSSYKKEIINPDNYMIIGIKRVNRRNVNVNDFYFTNHYDRKNSPMKLGNYPMKSKTIFGYKKND